MASKAVESRRALREALRDFAELMAKAFFGGLGAAILMGLAILALSATTQAAPLPPVDPKAGTLLLRPAGGGDYQAAPQVATEVAIEVSGIIARTRVTQHFHNPGSDAVEGVYVFPLPGKAAVDRLHMKIGERVIEGRIREKGEARREYERAKQEGRKAALVQQQRPNLFTNSVAHIGPGEYVEIRIEYQQALDYENGEFRLRFPLAVTPRYVPMGAREAIPDEPKAVEAIAEKAGGALLHPAYARVVPGPVNPVDIAVAIDAGVALGRVESSYHETGIAKQGDARALVYLVKEQEEADRDFELAWTLAPGAAPQAAMFTQQQGEMEYALLMVVPPQPNAAERAALARLPRETILVIDTSGSMQGASIQQAKEALAQALGTLGPGDRFNVVEFNSVTRPLYPEAMPASAANLRHAREWVARLAANGGTEMAGALAFALDARATPGYLRQVVFITDGAVGNEDALFRLIAERLGASRLFTVGIGSAPNSHFMTKAAQFGRGTFTHIGDVREVQEKMTRLFAKIEAPVLRDVAIRWPDGTPVETFPARVPDLYLGEPVLVAAAARAPLGTVVVSGVRGNQPWSVALTPPLDRNAAGVGALWARAKIASHMDELARGADPAQVRPQVVKVALEHHLVSAYTSLVAVDATPSALGELRTAMVRASLPQGSVEGTQLPQTDTPATLQLLLGLLALIAAGAVAAVGRRAASAA